MEAQQEPAEDVYEVNISRYSIIPPEGLILPTEVILPNVSQSRFAFEQAGARLGIGFPQAWNRSKMLEYLRERLRTYGYVEIDGIFRRERPLRLIPEGAEPVPLEVTLPEVIPIDVFSTRSNILNFISQYNINELIPITGRRLNREIFVHELEAFLVEHGYSIDPQGNLVKPGGLTLGLGKPYQDLINIRTILGILLSPETVTITQDDLTKLNLTIPSLLSRLGHSLWPSLELLAQSVGKLLSVNPMFIKVAFAMSYLSHASRGELRDILLFLGDTNISKRGIDILSRIKEYLRTKIKVVPREYKRRETLKGPAPQGLSLREAVQQGYSFTYKQYKNTIDDLLDYEPATKNHKNYLVELLQFYPDMLDPVFSFVIEDTLAREIIKLYYTHSYDIVQELYAYAVNYPLSYPESPEKTQRRQAIKALPKSYMGALYSIYASTDIEEILEMKQNPLELYLTAISRTKIQDLRALVAGFGMIVPEHLLTRMIRHYILQNIGSYRFTLTRSKDTPPIMESIKQPDNVLELIYALKVYTDSEIIEAFGYTGGFETREMLIENIYNLMSEEGFIIVNTTDRAVNVETTLLTSIADLPRPYLAFGTPFRYYILELEELLIAFREEGKDFRFRNVYGSPIDNYTIAQVSRLQTILPMMKALNPLLSILADQIVEKIIGGIARNIRRNHRVDTIMKEIQNKPPEIRNLVKDLFYKVFYTGMYMRGWEGPGNRFPVKSAQTRTGSKVHSRVIIILGNVSDVLQRLEQEEPHRDLVKQIQRLPDISYDERSGDIIFRTEKLFTYITQAANGNECIRMASRHLIISAYYYLSVLFGEVIPEFDPHAVEPIS